MNQETNHVEFPRNNARGFLALLFGDQPPDFMEVRLVPSGKQKFSKDLDEIINFIETNLDTNVFFGAASRKDHNGSKQGTSKVSCLWVDIDWKDFEGGQAEADELIRKFPKPPSIIICSGHGYHLYWLLEVPQAATLEIEGYLKGLAKALHADIAAAEIARCMRFPWTYNYKDPEAVVATEWYTSAGPFYKISDFDEWKIDVKEEKKRTINFGDSANTVDLGKFRLSPKILTLITTGWQNKGHKSRSEADQAVITALVRKKATDNEIRDVFKIYPIGEKYREKGSSGDQYLELSIQSAEEYIKGQSTEPNIIEIDASCGDLVKLADEAWDALVAANDPPSYFLYGGLICRIKMDDQNRAFTNIVTQDRLTYVLARATQWYVNKQKQNSFEKKPTAPPARIVRDMLARPDPPLPILTRIVECPFSVLMAIS